MPRYTLVMLTLPDIITPDVGEAASQTMMGKIPVMALEMGLYQDRGTLEVKDLEAAFDDGQMTERGPDHPLHGVRSLAVGDFLVEDNGDVHLCAPVGWETPVEEIADQVRFLTNEAIAENLPF